MTENDIKIPEELIDLADKGIWPSTYKEMQEQDSNSIIALNILKQYFPDAETICFEALPFKTIQSLVDNGESFWVDFGLDNIDLSKLMIIGDFGFGTDTTIALDYTDNKVSPSIIVTEWYSGLNDSGVKVRWIKVADTFKEFANRLGLEV